MNREQQLKALAYAESQQREVIGQALARILRDVPSVGMATEETRVAAIVAEQIRRAMATLGVEVL